MSKLSSNKKNMSAFFNDNSFYKFPKWLFASEFDDMSIEAKILYALMLDRVSLSEKNKWQNEDGEEFIYFTIEHSRELLHIGKNKAVRIFKELEEAHLISRKEMGRGLPDQIVVNDPVGLENKPEKFINQTPEVYKKDANQTEKNNTKFINLSDARVCLEQPILSADEDAKKPEIFYSDADNDSNTNQILSKVRTQLNTDDLSMPDIDDKKDFKRFCNTVVKELSKKMKDPKYTEETISVDISELCEQNSILDWTKKCYKTWNMYFSSRSKTRNPIRRRSGYFPSFFTSYLNGDYDDYLSSVKPKKEGCRNPYGYGSRFAVKPPAESFTDVTLKTSNSNSVDPYDSEVLQMNSLSSFLDETYTLA